MNKFHFAFIGMLFYFNGNSQTTTTSAPASSTTQTQAAPSNCYTRWEEKFEERGADDVKDGVYDNVIISVRSGPAAQCYNGKVEVKDGKIISMQRQLADGTYEEYKPKLKYEIPMKIVNGISVPLISQDDDLINVIFPKTLKPKKVGYASAPDPPQD